MLFVNRYTITKSLMQQWSKQSVNKAVRFFKILWVVMFVFCLILFIATLVMNMPLLYSAISLLFTLYCAYRGWILPRLQFNKYFDLVSHQRGSEEWERVITIDDNVVVRDGTATMEYDWTYFSSVSVKGDVILLLSEKDTLALRLYTNSFSAGNAKDFLEFLENEHAQLLKN